MRIQCCSRNEPVGQECNSELRDEVRFVSQKIIKCNISSAQLIAFWQMTIPPRERPRFAETVGVLTNVSIFVDNRY